MLKTHFISFFILQTLTYQTKICSYKQLNIYINNKPNSFLPLIDSQTNPIMRSSKNNYNISPINRMFVAQRDNISPKRDTSPKHNHKNKSHHNFYSAQQVSRMIKAYIQPKLNFFHNQLEQKQKIIINLNRIIDENDQKIAKMYSYVERVNRMQNQIHGTQNQSYLKTIESINQIINDKLKQYWQTITSQIQKIKSQFKQTSQQQSFILQQKIHHSISLMKKQLQSYIEQYRQRNNNYWLKIKQALNRINSKLIKTQQTTSNNINTINQFKQKTQKQYEMINQLKKSKQVVKKVIQLKHSVNNIYKNYESLLELQERFALNLNQNTKLSEGSGNYNDDRMYYKQQQQQTNQKLPKHNNNEELIYFEEDLESFQNQNQPQIYQNQGGNTFPMFRKPNSNKIQANYDPFSNTNPRLNFMKNTSDHFDFTQRQQQHMMNDQQNIALEYSKEQPMMVGGNQRNSFSKKGLTQSQNRGPFQFQSKSNARLHAVNQGGFGRFSLQRNNKKQNQNIQMPTKYYVPNIMKDKNNKKLLHQEQTSPLKFSPQSVKYQNGNQLSQGISCLNSTSNPFQHTNSRSTSFVNLSLQHRHQMSQSIKQRLQTVIELKNLQKPLQVCLDEINYLKNRQGNYIFDVKGNMFKLNKQEGKELERLGVIRFIVNNSKEKTPKGNNGNLNSRNVDFNNFRTIKDTIKTTGKKQVISTQKRDGNNMLTPNVNSKSRSLFSSQANHKPDSNNILTTNSRLM